MIPIKLKVENFCSYENAEIDFLDMPKTCIVAPTGSGKSFLVFDGIAMSLYEKSRKKDVASLVQHGKDSMKISFDFKAKDGSTVSIVRNVSLNGKRASSTLSVHIDGEAVNEKHKKDMQKRIEELVGMNYEAFTNSVLLMQNGSGDFFGMSKSDQTNFLIELFNVDRFIKYGEIASEKKKKYEKELDIIEFQIESKEEKEQNLFNATADISLYKDLLSKKESDLKNSSSKIDTFIVQKKKHEEEVRLTSEYDALNKKLQEKKDEKASYVSNYNLAIEKSKKDKIEKINKIKEENKELFTKLSQLKLEKDILLKSLSESNKVDLEKELDQIMDQNSTYITNVNLYEKEEKIKTDKLNEDLSKINSDSKVAENILSTTLAEGKEVKERLVIAKERLANIPKCTNCGEPNEEAKKVAKKDVEELTDLVDKKRSKYIEKNNALKLLCDKKSFIERSKEELEKYVSAKRDRVELMKPDTDRQSDIQVFIKKISADNTSLSDVKNSIIVTNATIEKNNANIEMKSSESEDDLYKNKVSAYDGEIESISESTVMSKSLLPKNPIKYVSDDHNKEVLLKNSIEKEVNELKSKIEVSKSNEERLKKEVEVIIKASKKGDIISSKISDLEVIQKNCSKTGIPLKMLNSYLDTIASGVNEILSKVSEFSISFNTMKEKKDGSLSSELDIIVLHGSHSDSIESLSGGQMSILRLAFILTISEIISTMHGNIGGFLALDEAIVGLDNDTELAICEMLSGKLSDMGYFWIISHSQQVQSLFDNILRIEKENGISKIIQ